jgi:hypothetical protein
MLPGDAALRMWRNSAAIASRPAPRRQTTRRRCSPYLAGSRLPGSRPPYRCLAHFAACLALQALDRSRSQNAASIRSASSVVSGSASDSPEGCTTPKPSIWMYAACPPPGCGGTAHRSRRRQYIQLTAGDRRQGGGPVPLFGMRRVCPELLIFNK